MTHHQGSHGHPQPTRSWWVVSAWASLVLLALSGLAGAAGMG